MLVLNGYKKWFVSFVHLGSTLWQMERSIVWEGPKRVYEGRRFRLGLGRNFSWLVSSPFKIKPWIFVFQTDSGSSADFWRRTRSASFSTF